jgi:hypothetical protein
MASPMAATRAQREQFEVVPGENQAGTPIFSVLAKRTYDIRPGHEAVRAEQDHPLVKADVYYDDGAPDSPTVQYETDLVAYKLATDIVLIGKAYAASAKPTAQMNVALEVAGRNKTLRVTGDRRCVYRDSRAPSFTDPVPFTEMEIRYDRAYGGKDLKSIPNLEFHYPRNHSGTGVVLKNVREAVDGLALPNVEDPADLLTPERVIMGEPERWNRQPLPQGFGWFQKSWYPRCSFVCSMPPFVGIEDVLREEELGLVPKGQIALARQFKLPRYDARFHNGASLGFVLPYLSGGEPVKLTGLTPEGQLKFTLPNDRPRAMLDIGLGENELPMVLHTVLIRPDERQVDLVWGGAHEYPGVEWLPEMKHMIAKVF